MSMSPHSRSARRIVIAVVASLVLHVALLPLVRMPQARAEPMPSPDVIVLRHADVIPPTPPPTPHPTPIPTPLPHVVPTVAAPIAAHPQRHVALHIPRAVAIASSAPDEPRAQSGLGNGPPGPATSGGPGEPGSLVPAGPPEALPTAPPATSEPLQTPPPACAKPDVAAHVITTVEPEIPEAARALGQVTGVVNVRVDLSESGSVLGVAVARSAGNGALDAAALDAARHSTYAAAIEDCRAQPGSYLFRVEFDG
jgi:protein TonB